MVDNLVIVYEIRNFAKANLIKLRLMSEGIDSMLEGEFLSQIGEASSPIKVKVRHEDVDNAEEVLRDMNLLK